MSRRLLVVGAHSADFVWRAGGAIAVTTSSGGEARVLALSYGERGESGELWKEPGQTIEHVKEVRHGEAERAASVLGASFACLDLGDYPLDVDRNDLVTIADRIRENFRKMRKASVTEIIDNAITRTTSRTIITHGSTQMMVTSMLIFGGPALHYFALALTIGILFGIYSSVLVMAPLVRWLGIRADDMMKPPRKEKQEAVV